MKISVLVLSAPFDSQSSYTALKYCEAALQSGKTIHRVFFYQSGVHNGSAISTPPKDEVNLHQRWRALKETYDLELIVCIAAAARRGVVDESEAKRHGLAAHNLGEHFELSGLGQLIEAQALSDRFITFGS